MKPSILCKNQYTIRKVHADGHETTEAKFHNIPLQVFYDVVCGRWMGSNNSNPTSCIHSCWFGTGSSEPSGSDTGLQTPLWTYGWNYSNLVSWEKYLNEDQHICHKYTFKVDADSAHVGTVSEVGICVITGKGYLATGIATRALILDSEGNPMTITKTDLEVLYVDVIFEFILQDTEDFTWIPENYINWGSRSGTGWGPIFTLGMLNRLFFLGKMKENMFNIQIATLDISKTYQDENHEITVVNARLPQTTVPSQRYIKAIGIGYSSNNLILGYWKLPNANVIPPKTLSGMQVGVGDGEKRSYNAPLAEWVADTEQIYVNDVLQVRGVDYTCDNDFNSVNLIECSVLQDMEYIGQLTTAPQNIITPIVGIGPYADGGYKTALWNVSNPTLKYAFPENGVKAIKRFVLSGFRAIKSMSSSSMSWDSNWNNKTWVIQYSSDNDEWTTAGTATVVNNVAELVLETPISARYWRFTINGLTQGNWFAAESYTSIMAYGDSKPITFATVPAADAVITMNANVDCPMKNENFIIDVNPTFSI